jgi:hypothetical protein
MSFDSVELYGILFYIIITTLDNVRNTPYKLLVTAESCQDPKAEWTVAEWTGLNGPFPARADRIPLTRLINTSLQKPHLVRTARPPAADS